MSFHLGMALVLPIPYTFTSYNKDMDYKCKKVSNMCLSKDYQDGFKDMVLA